MIIYTLNSIIFRFQAMDIHEEMRNNSAELNVMQFNRTKQNCVHQNFG